ncbi:MAG: STAS domain-containing protein [Pararhodobacter sp.]|nr:STAS domain-containing protein [Pararhodobacter sp.]
MEAMFTTSRKVPMRCAAPAGEAGSAPATAPRDRHPSCPSNAGALQQPESGAERQPGMIALPERLDSRAAGALAEALLPCREQAMTLDASAVAFVGARCAELLLAARLACREHGRTLAIIDPSESFVAGLEGLGLAELAATADQATTGGVPT